MTTESFYIECIEAFQKATKKPSNFLQADDSFCNGLKGNLKKLYDFTKREESKGIKCNALLELMVQNFDTEQIWQQIELKNDALISFSVPILSKMVVNKAGLLFEKPEVTPEEGKVEDSCSDDDESIAEPSESEEGKDDDTEVVVDTERRSIVDDDFFKLHEMERFLNDEEKGDSDSGNNSENSDTEGSVDLFEGNSSEDEEELAKTAKYKDFFVAKSDRRNDRSFEEETEFEAPSSFEMRQKRLNKTIQEIEEEAVRDKSWQLKGEVTAENRPQNSLLEEVVEFDLTTRPAPVITEQTSLQLEDIIKQRIKDRVFDSVERKTKPVETPLEYKKKLVLDQEKSKESLAQIYEKEFLEQQAAMEDGEKEEKEPEIYQEVNAMLKSLFVKLDALSNFHFTPKPAVPELKIVSNLPAISMEEVAPVAASDATLLAPEEVKVRSKGDVVGKNERTVTDKNRERRKKKRLQKSHAKRKQEKEGTARKKIANTKNKNVKKAGESLDNVKSSKAFFSQLQEQVQSQIDKRKSSTSIKNDVHSISAKKLKL